MNGDIRRIQLIRRLIHEERFEEARLLLRETWHPQVPELESRLSRLIEQRTPKTARPIITRWSLVLGLLIGLLLTALNLGGEVYNLPYLALCFITGCLIGVVLPEHERRRQKTREVFRDAFLRERRRFQKVR